MILYFNCNPSTLMIVCYYLRALTVLSDGLYRNLTDIAQLSQLRHVETKNPLFFNGSSQKVCTTFARLFLQ